MSEEAGAPLFPSCEVFDCLHAYLREMTDVTFLIACKLVDHALAIGQL